MPANPGHPHRSAPVAPVALAVALAAAIAFATLPDPARAADCGGARRCACGDRVTESVTLDSDLGVCTGVGLEIASGVVLDCAGHTITGSDAPGAWYGIHLDRATGAEVRGCRVTAFRRAIRVRGGSGNAVIGNEVFGNRYGIELAGASTHNRIEANLVRDNRDEGIHVGSFSDDNEIVANEVRYSKRENLYLLRAHRCTIQDNLLHHSRKAAIYVKHSSDNRFSGNQVRDRPVQVRGDSTGNRFEANYLKGDGYLFEAYEDAGGWTFPHDNQSDGDKIRKTDFCFRFRGAQDNHATALRTDGRCAPIVETALGGIEATGNTVELELPPP